jgi:hypothetical protein
MKATVAALALLMIAVVGIPTAASCVEFNDVGVGIDGGGPTTVRQACTLMMTGVNVMR